MNDEFNLISLLQIPIDFVGFIFYNKSPRNCKLKAALVKQIWRDAEFSPKKVGVFVNESEDFVLEKAEAYELDYVQLHGNESLFFCESLHEKGIKIIKAFAVDEQFSFSNAEAYQFYCEYFLFDTKGKAPGGNGFKFNWNKLAEEKISLPFFLSGGISKDDVDSIKALNIDQLVAVDINSKFELEAGVKNLEDVSVFTYSLKKPGRYLEYVNVKSNE